MAVVSGIVGACSPIVNEHGYRGDPTAIAQVEAGAISKQDVYDLLGSPTTRSTFGDDVWFYIGSRTDRLAFFEPEVVERLIIEVRFDETEYVAEIRQYDVEAGRDVRPVDRETPTRGNELTFLDQLIGNFGRFNN